MNINERELSLQYLFHLKTLEYAKRYANREIKQVKAAIQILKNDINNLSIPRCVANPNIEQPSEWYSMNWVGKWFVFLGLSTIAIGILFFSFGVQTRFEANAGIVLLKLLCIIFAFISLINIFSSYSANKGILKQYNDASAQYDYYCKQEQQRLAYEDTIKNNKMNELNKYLEEENQLLGLLKNIKAARVLLYSVNYIPYQYRNLEAVGFFYSQVESSPIVLNELIRYDPNLVVNGYESMPDFIKVQDEIYSFPTVNRIDFWNSCSLLTQKFDEYISEKDENSIEHNMQNLIATIRREGLGMKYNFNGPVTAGVIGDKNEGEILVNSPMADYQSSIEEEINNKMIKRIIDDMAEKITQANAENSQELLQKLKELEPQLARQESEAKETWWERIKEGLQVFSDLAGIAGFALSSYTLFK